MLIAIFLIIMGWILAFFAFKSKGTVIAMFLMVVAFGLSIIALPFITATNNLSYPSISISSPSGITTIAPYNVTNTLNNQTESYAFGLGEVNVLIQVGLLLLIIGYIFWNRKKEKIKKYNA